MALFKTGVVTTQGKNLLAKIQSGAISKLTFSKLEVGNGTYAENDTLSDATGLKSMKASFGLSSVTYVNPSTSKVSALISNAKVTEEFNITETGLYAKDENGKDILYAIAITETGKADLLPSNTAANPSTFLYSFNLAVGNAASVTITEDSSAYAHAEQVNNIKNEITNINGYLPESVFFTLSSSGWTASGESSIQTVAVNGVNADESKQLVIICPSMESMEEYIKDNIVATAQEKNLLTFKAETAPSVNITCYAILQAVKAV